MSVFRLVREAQKRMCGQTSYTTVEGTYSIKKLVCLKGKRMKSGHDRHRGNLNKDIGGISEALPRKAK